MQAYRSFPLASYEICFQSSSQPVKTKSSQCHISGKKKVSLGSGLLAELWWLWSELCCWKPVWESKSVITFIGRCHGLRQQEGRIGKYHGVSKAEQQWRGGEWAAAKSILILLKMDPFVWWEVIKMWDHVVCIKYVLCAVWRRDCLPAYGRGSKKYERDSFFRKKMEKI